MSVGMRKENLREIANLDEMKAFAGEVTSLAVGHRRLLVLLDGPMGAGKTQFTKFLIEALGGGDEANSPSFAIHNRYESIQGRGVGPVDHLDLFRLESEEDLESTGFWDFFREKQGIVIVEWAERLRELGLASHLPRTWPRLELKFERDVETTDAEVTGPSAAAVDERRRVWVRWVEVGGDEDPRIQ